MKIDTVIIITLSFCQTLLSAEITEKEFSELNSQEKIIQNAFKQTKVLDDIAQHKERRKEINEMKVEAKAMIERIDSISSDDIERWNQEFLKSWTPAYLHFLIANVSEDRDERNYHSKKAVERAEEAHHIIERIKKRYAETKGLDFKDSVDWLDNQMFTDRILSLKAKCAIYLGKSEREVRGVLNQISDRYRAEYNLKQNPELGRYLIEPSPEPSSIPTIVLIGLGLVLLILFIVLWMTGPTLGPIAYFVVRAILALGASGFAIAITGFLEVKFPGYVEAGGAFAIFVLVYLFNPPPPPQATPKELESR